MDEKRYCKRITFPATVEIEFQQRSYPGELLDLSMKGALIQPDGDITLQKKENASIKITLPMSELILSFEAELVHLYKNNMGFKFISVDIDTMTHLRRLMELNTGNSEQVHEEIKFWLKEV